LPRESITVSVLGDTWTRGEKSWTRGNSHATKSPGECRTKKATKRRKINGKWRLNDQKGRGGARPERKAKKGKVTKNGGARGAPGMVTSEKAHRERCASVPRKKNAQIEKESMRDRGLCCCKGKKSKRGKKGKSLNRWHEPDCGWGRESWFTKRVWKKKGEKRTETKKRPVFLKGENSRGHGKVVKSGVKRKGKGATGEKRNEVKEEHKGQKREGSGGRYAQQGLKKKET